ncbi:hypothetical protein BCR39DRAFT_147592 [Naematelia encephala]|uniref:BZIP domain-containing protein n=1 Tax=Naematelia encephala TaxID=71784 RepID=A0A1Y2BJX7_9TREE|nr:hypothetical protein BCR39DRAFT_147592 [Naematelia encephala]
MSTSQPSTVKNRASLVGKKNRWLERISTHRKVLEAPDLGTYSEKQENEENTPTHDARKRRRRAQNQAAQKAFRQRRDTRRKMLEDRVNEMEGQLSVTRLENKHLRAVITHLHKELASGQRWNSPSFLSNASSSINLIPKPSQSTSDLGDSVSLQETGVRNETGVHDESPHPDRTDYDGVCLPDIYLEPDFAEISNLASNTGPQNSAELSALRNTINYLDPPQPGEENIATPAFDSYEHTSEHTRKWHLGLEEWPHGRSPQSLSVVRWRYSLDAQDEQYPASTPYYGRSDESVCDFMSSLEWQQPWSWEDQPCVLEVDSL